MKNYYDLEGAELTIKRKYKQKNHAVLKQNVINFYEGLYFDLVLKVVFNPLILLYDNKIET